jgi:hypothetical protein
VFRTVVEEDNSIEKRYVPLSHVIIRRDAVQSAQCVVPIVPRAALRTEYCVLGTLSSVRTRPAGRPRARQGVVRRPCANPNEVILDRSWMASNSPLAQRTHVFPAKTNVMDPNKKVSAAGDAANRSDRIERLYFGG